MNEVSSALMGERGQMMSDLRGVKVEIDREILGGEESIERLIRDPKDLNRWVGVLKKYSSLPKVREASEKLGVGIDLNGRFGTMLTGMAKEGITAIKTASKGSVDTQVVESEVAKIKNVVQNAERDRMKNMIQRFETVSKLIGEVLQENKIKPVAGINDPHIIP